MRTFCKKVVSRFTRRNEEGQSLLETAVAMIWARVTHSPKDCQCLAARVHLPLWPKMTNMGAMRKPAARPAPAAPRPDPLAELRDRRGEPPAAFTATDAKKRFGRVLEMVLRGGAVVITRHDAPKAILISVDDFNALTRPTDRTLDALSADFDAMLARMQTPKARAREIGRASCRERV